MPLSQVTAIYITPEEGSDLRAVDSVRAVPGQGLEGDRYFLGGGLFKKLGPEQEVTLIEAEAIEGAIRDYGVSLNPAETRRNIVTRGVALNHLVGAEFTVGSVRLRGIMLCEPCGYLAKKTSKEVSKALVHRGGLRAQILTEGTITVGDAIGV